MNGKLVGANKILAAEHLHRVVGRGGDEKVRDGASNALPYEHPGTNQEREQRAYVWKKVADSRVKSWARS